MNDDQLAFLSVLALTPANIHAAMNDIPFNDRPATVLWVRIPVQMVFLGMLAFVAWRSKRKPMAGLLGQLPPSPGKRCPFD